MSRETREKIEKAAKDNAFHSESARKNKETTANTSAVLKNYAVRSSAD